MSLILLKIWERLSRAIATFPDLGDRDIIVSMGVYALFILILGVTTGFLRWDLCKSRDVVMRVVTTSLIAPAILEELVFRVILLPYPYY